jgi:N-acetylmuramoyl-L-alanine amidase
VEDEERKMKALKCGSIVFLLLLGLVSSSPLSGAERLAVQDIVVIDPAHGGDDNGVKLSDDQYEKDITLKIAQELQKELQGSGTTVQLTRTGDRDVPVAERIKMVRSVQARMLISIHINAGFGKKATGYEVYFPGFTPAPAGNVGAAGIIKDMEGNKHLNESVALAQSVMRNLQELFPRKERGLRDAPVPVLEGLTVPAVAVEIGFATNTEDKKIFTDEKGQKAVAQALTKGVREFLRQRNKPR